MPLPAATLRKAGQSPHAFCMISIARETCSVLANIVNNEYWMGTLLHEFGHSVYSSKNIPPTLPYLLRMESHILTTEGVAMMFGCPPQARWIEKRTKKSTTRRRSTTPPARCKRNQLLIFSRWCQVMLRFEKGMYENPDADLNDLWWTLRPSTRV